MIIREREILHELGNFSTDSQVSFMDSAQVIYKAAQSDHFAASIAYADQYLIFWVKVNQIAKTRWYIHCRKLVILLV
jgi:hypothetical protein